MSAQNLAQFNLTSSQQHLHSPSVTSDPRSLTKEEPIYSNSSLFTSINSQEKGRNQLVEQFSKKSVGTKASQKSSNIIGQRKSVDKQINPSAYNDLQFPSTSNYGSMKRKKKDGSGQDSNSGAGVECTSFEFTEDAYNDKNVKIWSLQYVPH